MTWSYRVVDHGDYLAVHEAFYDDQGHVYAWTSRPVEFVGDTLDEVVEGLTRALNDARRFRVLEPSTAAGTVDPATKLA